MGQAHGSDIPGCRGLFEESVDRFLMEAGLKEVLQLGESLVRLGLELDLQSGPLLDSISVRAAEGLKVLEVQITGRDEAEAVQMKKDRLRDGEGIDLIGLGFPDVVFPEDRGLDRVDNTDLAALADKEADKVVAIVSRRLKTDDDAVV